MDSATLTTRAQALLEAIEKARFRWSPAKHPRWPKGHPKGGQFKPKSGGKGAKPTLGRLNAVAGELADIDPANASKYKVQAVAAEVTDSTFDDLFTLRNKPGHNIKRINIDGADADVDALFPGKTVADVEQMAKEVVADYGTQERFDVSVKLWDHGEMKMQFDGNEGTFIKRSFNRGYGGTLRATHDSFFAGETNTGSAKGVLRGSIAAYRKMGIDNIGLLANGDVGSYAWARFGFVPTEWNDLRKELSNSLQTNEYYAKTLAPVERQTLDALLKSDDPKTIWKIADMRHGDSNTGKKMLLNRLGWKGYLDLNDPEAMKRLGHYVKDQPAALPPKPGKPGIDVPGGDLSRITEVAYKGSTFYPTGKLGTSMKTGLPSIELEDNQSRRIWVQEDGTIDEDF